MFTNFGSVFRNPLRHVIQSSHFLIGLKLCSTEFPNIFDDDGEDDVGDVDDVDNTDPHGAQCPSMLIADSGLERMGMVFQLIANTVVT